MNQVSKNAKSNFIRQDYFEEDFDLIRMRIQVNELFNHQKQIDSCDREDFLKIFKDLNNHKVTDETQRTLKKLQINYV